MKFFKIKYLLASLVLHSAVINSFLLIKNSTEKAETFMLVTEIIQIEESNKSNDVKKIKNYKTKNKEKEHVNIKKVKEQDIQIKVALKPKVIPVRLKSNKSETKFKTNDVKKALVENKPIESPSSYNKKSSENKLSQNKNLSKANYKIGSINNPHPPYPLIARKKGLEGKLILKVTVNEDGSVKDVTINKSSGYLILDKVSKETIEKWVFIPAKRMGRSVEDNIQVPIRFVLTE
tara:strand:- start:1231 stop:1932 length:702 start_codon:yes stop_codon:yes gene_type:complete